MKYTKLGRSDIEVSRICLGCMGFGVPDAHHPWTIDEKESENIMRIACEQGVNFFDTAMGYGNGTSEEYVGRIVKRIMPREKAVIATKFLPRTPEEQDKGIDGRRHVENCLNASLRRLDTDYVDLYIVHMWDYNTPVEEIMQGLDEAVKSGKARAVGISNCYAWQLEKANAVAERNGWTKFASMQGHHNLIFREEEREMIPCCEDNGITFMPYSPLASGRLAKPAGATSARLSSDEIAKGKYDNTAAEDAEIVSRTFEIASKYGCSPAQIALSWLLKKNTVPVVGATKQHHIQTALQSLDVELSDEDAAYLEEKYVPHRLVGVMQFNHK